MTIRRRGAPVLHVTGAVEAPATLDHGEVAGLGPLESTTPIGFDGEGVPVASLIDMATPGASHATVESDDGHYRASIPIEDLARGVLVLERNGRPLTRAQGGPFRLVVPDGRTLCWNVKGVVEIRFTYEPEPDSVPENPPH